MDYASIVRIFGWNVDGYADELCVYWVIYWKMILKVIRRWDGWRWLQKMELKGIRRREGRVVRR